MRHLSVIQNELELGNSIIPINGENDCHILNMTFITIDLN